MQSLAEDLQLAGIEMVSYVPQVREEQMVRICLYGHVHVCVWLCHYRYEFYAGIIIDLSKHRT